MCIIHLVESSNPQPLSESIESSVAFFGNDQDSTRIEFLSAFPAGGWRSIWLPMHYRSSKAQEGSHSVSSAETRMIYLSCVTVADWPPGSGANKGIELRSDPSDGDVRGMWGDER
ncbi:hypothetical protein BaRGS_00019060 [Batillaria attramentaria]|uniref:Uncharacterized protein n=1 Tax=Batillaria attramentaria TaxID=370345 RepID=A0ABD0KRA6_9CAEN